MSTDKNVIEDLEPGAAHGDTVRGGLMDDAPAMEKKEMKQAK